MLDSLYENIGEKIKGWAKWIFIVETISAIVIGLVLMVNGEDEAVLIGFVTILCGPIVSWVGSWLLYAFGQLVDDVHAMRDKQGTTEEIKAKKQALQEARHQAEMKAFREAEERAKREAEEIEKWQNENTAQIDELTDEDFIDITCPRCKETLSFLKDETNGICPECGAEFKI
ncbi:MAG: hypothetical protein IIW73_05480 [Clostridia bacterium]|nr:hypothetical protein [Clostridia bacterium]